MLIAVLTKTPSDLLSVELSLFVISPLDRPRFANSACACGVLSNAGFALTMLIAWSALKAIVWLEKIPTHTINKILIFNITVPIVN